MYPTRLRSQKICVRMALSPNVGLKRDFCGRNHKFWNCQNGAKPECGIETSPQLGRAYRSGHVRMALSPNVGLKLRALRIFDALRKVRMALSPNVGLKRTVRTLF